MSTQEILNIMSPLLVLSIKLMIAPLRMLKLVEIPEGEIMWKEDTNKTALSHKSINKEQLETFRELFEI